MSNLLKKTMKLYHDIVVSKNQGPSEIKQPKIRQLGEDRYNIPSVKEWKNNVYSFNKTSLKHLPLAKTLTDKLIKSYFNLTSFYNINSKNVSKRIRVVRKFSRKNRKSLNKIIVSEADIKHTNEKTSINISLLNKEKDSFLRKLYMMEKDKFNTIRKFINITSEQYNVYSELFKQGKATTNFDYINSNFLDNINKRTRFIYLLRNKKNSHLKNQNKMRAVRLLKLLSGGTTKKLNIRTKKRTRKMSNLMTRQIKKSYTHPIYKIRSLNFDRFPFKDKLIVYILKKKSFIRNLFFFSFLKWALWLLKIKISVRNDNKMKSLIIKGKQTNVLSIGDKTFFRNLKNINNILLHLIITSIKTTRIDLYNNNILKILFSYYKNNKLKIFLKKYLKKQITKLSQLYSLSLNNFKLGYYVPGLENLLSKILNKQVELNIVNIKYAHLNSDIFAQTISIKLKKKTSSLLRVLKRSLKLVKLPKTVLAKKVVNKKHIESYQVTPNSSTFENGFLKNYRTSRLSSVLNLSGLHNIGDKKDYLEIILSSIFTSKVNNGLDEISNKSLAIHRSDDTISKNIIDSIKNKWVKGVRVEAKGRLTKRYTASRSVFKYKYKGNLRAENTYTHLIKESKLSRGDIKANMQYSLVSSRRRIGAFGIKGWISSS